MNVALIGAIDFSIQVELLTDPLIPLEHQGQKKAPSRSTDILGVRKGLLFQINFLLA